MVHLSRSARELIEAALELPAEERIAFVERATEEEAEVRAEALAQLQRAGADSQDLDGGREHVLIPHSGTNQFALCSGDRHGPYELRQSLGVVGTTVVWEAKECSSQREVWLYLQAAEEVRGDAEVRLRAERASLARLNHPNIARVHGAGTSSSARSGRLLHWLAGEAVSGGEDLALAAGRHVLTLATRVSLVRQAASAVQAAHERGLLHGNLHSGCVLLLQGKEIKVSAFGLGRTQSTLPLEYLPPEQYGGAEPSDVRCDVWALGVLLYQVICGRFPYDLRGRSALQAAALLQAALPAPPSRIVAGVDPDLDAIVLRAIATDRSQRYGSADALHQDLLRWENGLAVAAGSQHLTTRARAFWHRNRRFALPLLGASLLLCTGLAASTSAWWRARASAQRAASARVLTEQAAYTANLAAAASALRMHEVAAAKRRLELVPPRQRGWEWSHLQSRTDGSLFAISAHEGGADALLSAGGGRIYSAGRDGMLRSWEGNGGALLSEKKAHDGAIDALVISPNGELFISIGRDGWARVFAAETLERVFETQANRGSIVAAAWSPDSQHIYFADSRGNVSRGNLRTQDRQQLYKSPVPVAHVQVHDDGTLLWILNRERGLAALQLDSEAAPAPVAERLQGNRVLAIHSESDLAFCSPDEHNIELRSLASGELLRVLAGHNAAVTDLAVSPAGDAVASSSRDGTVRVWDVASARTRAVLLGHTAAVLHVAYGNDGQSLVSGDQLGLVRRWDLSDPRRRQIELHDLYESQLVPAGSSREIWCANASVVQRIDPHSGRVLGESALGTGYRRASSSPNGDLVAVAGPTSLTLFNAKLERPDEVQFTAGDELTDVAWHPRSSLVVSSHSSGRLELRYPLTPKPHRVVESGQEKPTAIAFDPAGAWLALGDEQGQVVFFETKEWQLRSRVLPEIGPIRALAWSATGRKLAVGARSGAIAILERGSGHWTTTAILRAHAQPVGGLAFAPDDSRLASASEDATLRVWQCDPWLELVALHGHEGGINSVVWSSDGRVLTSSGSDGQILFWDGPELSPQDKAK